MTRTIYKKDIKMVFTLVEIYSTSLMKKTCKLYKYVKNKVTHSTVPLAHTTLANILKRINMPLRHCRYGWKEK